MDAAFGGPTGWAMHPDLQKVLLNEMQHGQFSSSLGHCVLIFGMMCESIWCFCTPPPGVVYT